MMGAFFFKAILVSYANGACVIDGSGTMKWHSNSGHLEKRDIEKKLFEVRDDNRKKELFKTV